MNFFKHLITIIRHRHAVLVHCVKAGIGFQGLFHDLSKFSPFEFFAGVKYYLGNKSPNEAQRTRFGYSSAWLHHKGRNKHHFEYWTDYSKIAGKVVPIKMPLKFLKEMFCDRLAASKIYQGKNYKDSHPYEYFMRGKPNRFIHPDTSDLLESLLLMLKDNGETKTFDYIKKLKKY